MVPQNITFWQAALNSVASNLFSGAITLIVGLVAYGVYSRQKRDEKRDAANIILLEIEDAERQLDKVSVARPFTGPDEEDVYLMKTASWDKYKYLFVRDLDRNEWDKVTNFYRECQSYDTSVVFNKQSVENNQQTVRANLQRILADHAKKFVDQLSDDPKKQKEQEAQYWARRDGYVEAIVGQQAKIFTYIPMQAENDARRALSDLDSSLSLTSAGLKLKAVVTRRSTLDRIIQVFRKN